MPDRTEDIEKFVSRYDELEVVTLRIRDAFDPSWWKKVGGRAMASDVGISLKDECMYPDLLCTIKCSSCPSTLH